MATLSGNVYYSDAIFMESYDDMTGAIVREDWTEVRKGTFQDVIDDCVRELTCVR